MSFSGTPLGQGRRLDHSAFLGKPSSSKDLPPASYSYGAPALGPRSPPKTSSPSRDDQDHENDSALSRFARLKQREAAKDLVHRPGGPKVITSPPKPDRWSVKDTSVNIATAFHQAVIDTVGGEEPVDMSNPNNAWASGSRAPLVPRSTSVEFESAAPHTSNRRLPAPPDKTGRVPTRKPPSKTTSLRHVPDSEGEEEQPSASRGRAKTPLEHGFTYAKQALGAATFYLRQRSTEPEDRSVEQPQASVNGNGHESSYEYTAEEQAFQAAKRANTSASASLNGSAAQRRNRISLDNKAYKPSRESEEEESEWSDDGTTRRRRKKSTKGRLGGPLSTLPVMSADKRKKKRRGHGGSKANMLDGEESESDENTQLDNQSYTGTRTSIPQAPPSRLSQEPSYHQDDSNISADQGLQSIPEIDETHLPSDTQAKSSQKPSSTVSQGPPRRRAGSRTRSRSRTPGPQLPPTRFSIGNLLGRTVNLIARLCVWTVSGAISFMSAITFLFGQVFGTTYDLILRKPAGWARSSGVASAIRYLIPALVLLLAWWALKDVSVPGVSFPGRSGVYTPPSVPPSDLGELTARLLKLEHLISGLALESERVRSKSEDSYKGLQDLRGQIGSLEGKFVTETKKVDDVERKAKDALSQGLSGVRREVEVLHEEVKHQRKLLEQQKEQVEHQPKTEVGGTDEEARLRLRALEERIGSVEGGVKDALEQLTKKAGNAAAPPAPSIGSAWWNKLAANVGSLKASNGQDVSAIISQMVDTAVFSAMTRDLIGKPDFAMHSTGAGVIPSLTSSTLQLEPAGFSSWAIGLFTNSGFSEGRPPVTALHHEAHHGHCWPFRGSSGQLGVMLARPAILDSFSIDHIPKEMAFDISSAPRRMEVWGLVEGADNHQKVREWREELKGLWEDASEEGKAALAVHIDGAAWASYPKTLPKKWDFLRLANFEYDVEKDRSVQTFDIDADVKRLGIDFGVVVLRVASNWGAEGFTCLYRLRVHGQALSMGPSLVEGEV